MRLWVVTSVAIVWSCANAANVTEAQNKSKRGLSEQIQIYGDPHGVKPGPSLYDQQASATTPSLVAFYANTQKSLIFNNQHQQHPINESPKQIQSPTAVVYDYQQAPSATQVQNIPQNQYYHPVAPAVVHGEYRVANPEDVNRPQNPETAHTQIVYTQYQPQPYQINPTQNLYTVHPIRPAESIATPVQHKTLVHHVQTNPLPPQPRYTQINGRVIYHPALPHANTYQPNPNTYQPNANTYQPSPNTYQPNPPQINYQPPKPANIYNPYNTFKASPRLIPPPVSAISYNFQNFHPKNLIKPTTTPAPIKEIKKQKSEEEEEEKLSKKEEEDDHDHYEREEEEEDDYSPYSGRYRHEEEDEEDDHEKYQIEDDEDEDSERGSSKYSKARSKPSKYKSYIKSPNKYESGDSYKFSEGYKSKTKYGKPYQEQGSKDGRKGKTHYKAYKYSRKGNDKPKIEMIEGRQSQQVPVVHSQKIFKEKWFVSNSHEE